MSAPGIILLQDPNLVVTLPHQLDAGSMYDLIGKVINTSRFPIHDEVTFDFATLSFIKPVGITILSNLIELLKQRGTTVKFRYDKVRTDATKYLDDSEFFEKYLGVKIFRDSEVRSTTLPLRLLRHRDTLAWLEYKLIPWLSARLNMSPRSFETISVCLQELFNNINDHAQEEIGSIFVQQYPNLNRIHIALSDFGVGIPYNVYKKVTAEHDGVAILFATREGFTSQSSPRNRGAGLDIFLNRLARNRGKAIIYSNRGALSCTHEARRPFLMPGKYPGTLFDIRLRTDTIESSSDGEDECFEW